MQASSSWKKHYHIIAGSHGRTPEINDAFARKKDTLTAIAELAQLCRDNGRKLYGSARAGHYEERNGRYSVDIKPCDESRCQLIA